jgi:hypothetical protein
VRLKLITPPSVEPVTAAEAKLHARVDITDDDALFASLITAARRYCETALKSALVTQTWTLYLDGFPTAGGYYNRDVRQVWMGNGGIPGGMMPMPGFIPNSTGIIDIPMPPLQSVTSVKYYDTAGVLQTVNAANYIVSTGTPGRIQPAYGQVWPLPRPTIDAVQITFVSGQGDAAANVSENVKTAIKMLVSHWYENREATTPTGNNFGTVPLGVDALLCPDDPGIYS